MISRYDICHGLFRTACLESYSTNIRQLDVVRRISLTLMCELDNQYHGLFIRCIGIAYLHITLVRYDEPSLQ